MLYASLLAALAFIQNASVAPKTDAIVSGVDGRVESYFGVPVSIDIDGVPSLNLKHRRSSLYTGEGITSRTEIIGGRNGVELVVSFNRRGKMLAITTTSRKAMDPRGVKVGNSLANVQAIWPCGKLYYGRSIEGGQRFARFLTGTNVVLEMSTTSFENLPILRVEKIKIVDFETSVFSEKKCLSNPR